jgi:nicotinamide-nucleotide amidase
MASYVELICIGNELLIGKVVNTNASWLAQQVTALGGDVRRISVVADNLDEISDGLRSTLERRPFLIITTGGLGPTYDDMTLEGVAKALGLGLEANFEALNMVRGKYASMSLEVTPARAKMARLPKGATALPNPVGTAPGCLICSAGSRIVCLPGVPAEMEAIFAQSIAPIVEEFSGGLVFKEASIIVEGMPESELAPILDAVRGLNPSAYFKSHPKMSEGVPLIEIHVSTRVKGSGSAMEIVGVGISDLKEAILPRGVRIIREIR